jgi:transcriptional regulator with XRE-family HTH domain
MSFNMLRIRLIGHLRTRIQNGELTERSLARFSGISQPHIHNVLKGAKILSPKFEDRILNTLRLSVLDLFSEDELRTHLDKGNGLERYRSLHVLDGLLGPGFPMPVHASRGEMYAVECALLAEMVQPSLARMGEDPDMTPFVRTDRLVLLDYSETARISFDRSNHYVVSIGGIGVIRLLIKQGLRLFAATERTRETPQHWQELTPGDDPLKFVLARVVWLDGA